MLRLLNIELQKMRYNRATKILLSIYALLFFSVVLFTSIQFKIGDLDFRPADQGIFNFPYIWHFNAYFAAILKIFPVFFFFFVLFTFNQFYIGDFRFRPSYQGIFNFPYILHFNSYFAAILKIFPALVIISMMTMEYNHRTLKQNLIDGLSKKEFVLS